MVPTSILIIAGHALAPFALAPSGKAEKFPQDGAEWLTNVEVTTQDGRTLRFYDVMKRKILLINFFYTDCDAVCPLMTENLAHVQDLLGARVGNEIRMGSISLQPDHDTPRYWLPTPRPMVPGQTECPSLARRTISNCFATCWALSTSTRSRTLTRTNTSAPCA